MTIDDYSALIDDLAGFAFLTSIKPIPLACTAHDEARVLATVQDALSAGPHPYVLDTILREWQRYLQALAAYTAQSEQIAQVAA